MIPEARRRPAAPRPVHGALWQHARMKRRSRPPSPDDIALFRDAIGPVRPLDAPPEPPRPEPPRPEPRQFEADEAEALASLRSLDLVAAGLEPGEPLRYLRDGHPPRLLQQLRRGAFSVRDEIDLHHLDVRTAERVLRAFLHEARRAGHGCVRVVHGKGLRSREELPVLKALVDQMLRHRNDVLAFCSCPPAQGGTGATLVLLRHSA